MDLLERILVPRRKRMLTECKGGSELFAAMLDAVTRGRRFRTTSDERSPTQSRTVEAAIGSSFLLRDVAVDNVPGGVRTDARWAAANVLQFFADTEQAGWLRKYNKHADRFLEGDRWPGAYGAIAMPQIRRCIELLRSSPYSRRAVVSMGTLEHDDINRPACWTSLHFLPDNGAVLDLLVYQRSLGMWVMPYDLSLLTNVLRFVAFSSRMAVGNLHWIVGSLHDKFPSELKTGNYPGSQLLFPTEVLGDPHECRRRLEHDEVLAG